LGLQSTLPSGWSLRLSAVPLSLPVGFDQVDQLQKRAGARGDELLKINGVLLSSPIVTAAWEPVVEHLGGLTTSVGGDLEKFQVQRGGIRVFASGLENAMGAFFEVPWNDLRKRRGIWRFPPGSMPGDFQCH